MPAQWGGVFTINYEGKENSIEPYGKRIDYYFSHQWSYVDDL